MTRPALTGGQRASAMLAGLVSHTLFAIGWFGLGFVLIAGALGGILHAFLSEVDVETLQRLFQSAGSIIWIVVIVFGVGSLFFVVLALTLSPQMLRRGGVPRPVGVTILSIIVAAIIDFPIFLFGGWLSHLTTNDQAGLVFLPPLFSLILVLVTGALIWWWIAHVFRAGEPVDPATVEGSRVVAVPVPPAPAEPTSEGAVNGDSPPSP